MDSRKTKRGRSGNPRATAGKITKKKAKGGAAAKAVETVVEERKEGNELVFPVVDTAELDEWASLWSSVDEEMSWANCWCPFWDMDDYDVVFEDVLWDYDIWDFNANNQSAPNP